MEFVDRFFRAAHDRTGLDESGDRPRVLVASTEQRHRDAVLACLGGHHIEVASAQALSDALRAVHQWRPNVIVADHGLAHDLGSPFVERVRAISDVPFLAVVWAGSRAMVADAIYGGADDCIVAPIDRTELVARISVLLWRAAAGSASGSITDDGFFRIERDSGRVWVGDRTVFLTPAQLRLLAVLVENPFQAVSSATLLEIVCGDAEAPEWRVRTHLSQLRRKLDPARPHDIPIRTVRGVGYVYEPPSDLPWSA